MGICLKSDAWFYKICIILALAHSAFAAEENFDWTESRATRSRARSVEISQPLEDTVEFVYNRGEGSVDFLSKLTQFLDPARIAKMKGYLNPHQTLISLWSYEIRSREAIDHVESLLKKGFNVEIIASADPATEFRIPSSEAQRKWTPHQRAAFLRTYDLDRSGSVDSQDEIAWNKKNQLAQKTWKRIEELSTRHAHLKLIQSPYEMIPQELQADYIRIQHFKMAGISFKGTQNTWKPAQEMITSANLTDSCLHQRVLGTPQNLERYAAGEPTKTDGKGHIQFGAILNNPALLTALRGPRSEWIKAFQSGKHFDSVPLPDERTPRVVIKDPRTGHTTTIEAFYSEGTGVKDGKKSIDPVYTPLVEILSNPDNELLRFETVDFVFTHKGVARHLRHHFAKPGFTNFSVIVDGNFATAPYSALPDLLFVTRRDNSPLVMSGKAITDYVSIPAENNWTDKVHVFEGTRGVVDHGGDKLHSKFSYLEYRSKSTGAQHYVVRFGSGNNSKNAGNLNADAIFYIDSTDPRVQTWVEPFLAGVKQENRLRRFSSAYLERRLMEMFNPTDAVFPGHTIEALQDPQSFLAKFEALLSQTKNHPQFRQKLKAAVKTLKAAGPANHYGSNFLDLLDWYSTHSPNKHLSWGDFELMLFTSNPYTKLEPGFVEDLGTRWAQKTQKTLKKVLQKRKSLKQNAPDELTPVARNLQRLTEQSKACFDRLLLPLAPRAGGRR